MYVNNLITDTNNGEKALQLVKETVIIYKADPDLELELQRKQTPAFRTS